MKEKCLHITIFLFGSLLILHGFNSHAQQKATKNITIVYSNNINGEIDPCPT
jgi:hypothetical protein